MTTVLAANASVGYHVDCAATGAPDVLYLHSEHGPRVEQPFVQALGAAGSVAVGHHPGYGEAPVNPNATTVTDLAFGYLSYLDTLPAGTKVDLVGSSLGGWVALHIATMYSHRIRNLALVAPLGLKLTPPSERDFLDVFAMSDTEINAVTFKDPAKAPFSGDTLSDDEILERAANREGLVRYGWEPYLHDRSLPHRLSRIAVPTLILTGTGDHLIRSGYYEEFAQLVPGARLQFLEDVGHYAAIEDPESAASVVTDFLA
jgi:pimeloyl-ACP methyl ester carboxylesterase